MTVSFNISPADYDTLTRAPGQPLSGQMGRAGFTAQVAIAGYSAKVKDHYGALYGESLNDACDTAEITSLFENFGLICRFDAPTELNIHDQDRVLDPAIKVAIDRFGALILKNAYLGEVDREQGQHNIFPNLKFHFDRASNQVEQYSMYSRNPFNPEQVEPRESSTVFIGNDVACCQDHKEGHLSGVKKWRRTNHVLFAGEDVPKLIGNVILEHPWDEPKGTGEISLIDNRTILHASYYRSSSRGGYRIGVRYLK